MQLSKKFYIYPKHSTKRDPPKIFLNWGGPSKHMVIRRRLSLPDIHFLICQSHRKPTRLFKTPKKQHFAVDNYFIFDALNSLVFCGALGIDIFSEYGSHLALICSGVLHSFYDLWATNLRLVKLYF